jgi:hypothetical protein
MSSTISLTTSSSNESTQITEQMDSKMKSITLKEEDSTIDDWEQLDQQVLIY